MADIVATDIASREIEIDTDTSTDCFKVKRKGQTNILLKIRCGSSNQGSLYIYDSSGNVKTSIDGSNGVCVIGGATALTCAQLQADSTTKAFVPPRMTAAQMQAISTPVSGAMVYNSTSGALCVWNGKWYNLNLSAQQVI